MLSESTLKAQLMGAGYPESQAKAIASNLVSAQNAGPSYAQQLADKAAQDAQQRAQWQESAVEQVYSLCDADGALRAACERTRASRCALRDELEGLRGRVEATGRERYPETNEAVLARETKLGRYRNRIHDLESETVTAEQSYVATHALLTLAFTAALERLKRDSAQIPKQIRARAEQEAIAAEQEAGRWSWLGKQLELGRIEI